MVRPGEVLLARKNGSHDARLIVNDGVPGGVMYYVVEHSRAVVPALSLYRRALQGLGVGPL